MNDIKITDISGHRLGGAGNKPDFEKKHMAQMVPSEAKAPEPSEKIKVKFEKFISLVATHNFEEVMRKHGGEDIVLSTNLLTDLASSHEEDPPEGKKLPIIFIVGIIVGVVVTYLLIRF